MNKNTKYFTSFTGSHLKMNSVRVTDNKTSWDSCEMIGLQMKHLECLATQTLQSASKQVDRVRPIILNIVHSHFKHNVINILK